MDEKQEERRDDEEEGGDREDEPRAGDGEQHACERRAGEDGDALDAARDGVCGGELLGVRARLGVSAACDDRNGVVAIVAAMERA